MRGTRGTCHPMNHTSPHIPSTPGRSNLLLSLLLSTFRPYGPALLEHRGVKPPPYCNCVRTASENYPRLAAQLRTPPPKDPKLPAGRALECTSMPPDPGMPASPYTFDFLLRAPRGRGTTWKMFFIIENGLGVVWGGRGALGRLIQVYT